MNSQKMNRWTARIILSVYIIMSLPLTVLAEPDSDPDHVIVDNTVKVNLSLDKVESELESSNVKLDSANSTLGTISKNVDGTNTYLAKIQENTGKTNNLLGETNSLLQQNNVLLNDIKGLMGAKGTAAVTEVYSLNNEIQNCYYKPSLEDVHMLEQFVLANGFANAYTGFFDLNHTSPYTANSESRALEILGYDYLLSNEAYDGNTYKAERITGGISKRTAVMDVYKALGREIQQVQLYYSATDKKTLISSPAIKDLSWIVNNIDSSRGKTTAFITRTNPDMYAAQAKSDLHLSDEAVSATTPITLGEFIVLVASMMDFYGEPVISDTEMCALLQVFGGKIPTSLSGAQRSAYIYLRSRGILTDDYKVFSGNLKVTDMCNILMRVKDTDSRQNLKEIQVTMDINDNLKSAGYFPKSVSLNTDSKSIQVDKEYYYKDAVYYDYLIDKESSGFKGNTVFIPVDINNYLTSKTLSGADYRGIDKIDGKDCYHFRITVAAPNTDYFNTTKAVTGLDNAFLIAEADSDHFIAVTQGGGVYKVSKSQSGVYLTSRNSFVKEQEGYIDKERKESSESNGNVDLSAKGAISKIISAFRPLVVHATGNAPTVAANNASTSGVNVQLTVYNWSNVKKNYDDQALQADSWLQTQVALYSQANINADDTATLVMPQNVVDTFLQYIEREDSLATANPAVNAIANITGQTLLNVDDLVTMGLVYKTSDTWDASNDTMVLDTKYGRVVLDQADNLIVAGTTMYRVPEGTVLFSGDPISGSYYVDFRAVYGWSANIANITITGNQGSYAVSVESVSNHSKTIAYTPIKEYDLRITPVFDNDGNSKCKALFVDKNIITGNKMLLMSSNYFLSNWMILESGTADYLYVFYHKDAFESFGLTPPDGIASMKSRCYPYSSVDKDNWVVREVEITKTKSLEPGTMYYDDKLGYLYNVPDESQFSIEAYLNGNLLLPVYSTDESVSTAYNANVNIWPGYKYGSRPDINKNKTVSINWDGTKEQVPQSASVIDVKATPAGVQALFGNVDLVSVTKSNIDALLQDANTQSALGLYYGTSKLSIKDANGKYTMRIGIGSGTAPNGDSFNGYDKSISMSDSNTFYEMAKWQLGKGIDIINRRYICFDGVRESASESDVQTDEDITNRVKIDDAGFDDSYDNFDKFSLQWILDQIDSGASIILFVTVKIIPMLMIIALTCIVGFVFMADSKLVRKIMGKVIDPVKILTFGKKTIDEMSKKKCLITLMIGYFVFILIADGNILRIIMFFSEVFESVLKLLRTM